MRETALDALVANLEDISIANGYSLNVKKVLRYDDAQRIAASAYPAIMVADNDDEERDPRPGGFADVYFTVNLIGLVKSRSNASQSMNELDVAIKKAIAADRTLGGTVAHVTILPRVDTDLDGKELDSAFTRPVRVFYVATESNGD